MRLRYAAVIAVPLVVAASACGMIIRPGTPGTGSGPGTHSVSYTVRCEQCRVTYTTGLGMAEEDAKGVWSKTVSLSGSSTRLVMLTAFPTSSTALVSHAYIEVDGKKVAEARQNTHEAFSDRVTLSAPLSDFPGGEGAPWL